MFPGLVLASYHHLLPPDTLYPYSQYTLNSSPLQFKVFPPSIPYLPTFPNLWKTPIALGVRDTLEGRFLLLHLCFPPPKQESVEDVDSCIPIPPPTSICNDSILYPEQDFKLVDFGLHHPVPLKCDGNQRTLARDRNLGNIY